jgi:hypothetical protein
VAISLAQVEASALAHTVPALEIYGGRIGDQIEASAYVTRFPPSVDPSPYPATRRFRETGPADAGRPPSGPLPDWWQGSDAPLVYVTFGTMAGGTAVGDAAFRTVLGAVSGLPVRVPLTAGRATDIQALGDLPAIVHVEAWVPQPDVLAAATAVVCHGGSGTTFGALAAGLRLVIVPMFADQPANARLVESIGAGLAVEPTGESQGRVSAPAPGDAPRIRQSLESILADDRAGVPVTFAGVARAAGISRSWLYSQSDISSQIRRLHEKTDGVGTIPALQRATDASLRARLTAALDRNRQLADENARLRRQLAHALGAVRREHRTPPPQ